MVNKVVKKQNLIQTHNHKIAVLSIIALFAFVFLPVIIDPLLNGISYELVTIYQKISSFLIAIFAIFAVYTGIRGWDMSLKRTHKTVYVTAISVGLLAFVQFLWMGLPTIFE